MIMLVLASFGIRAMAVAEAAMVRKHANAVVGSAMREGGGINAASGSKTLQLQSPQPEVELAQNSTEASAAISAAVAALMTSTSFSADPSATGLSAKERLFTQKKKIGDSVDGGPQDARTESSGRR